MNLLLWATHGASTMTERRTGVLADMVNIGQLRKAEAEIERLRALKTPASAQLLNVTKALLDEANAEIERLLAEIKKLKVKLRHNVAYGAEK
jgi:hypothetical protein